MTAVPFADLAAATEEVWPSIKASYLTTLLNANYIGGVPVKTFEYEWAAYCGVDYGVGLANGTDALELTLSALGIGHGDEVIVPASTFVATAAAVARVGAVPRFADVSDDTLLITPHTLAAATTPQTRAVIIVHLYGQVPDMAALLSVANDNGILVIEDAAQAHGATWDGRRAGSFGTAACFSFYPGKNLGAFGDGGMVVTSRPDLADRIRALANHGRLNGSSHYEHAYIGRNSRLDALQAIVLSAKLSMLESWNERRNVLAELYRKRLGGTDVRLIGTSPLAGHVYHLFVVRTPERNRVGGELKRRGVQTGVHYPVPCHWHPPLRQFSDKPLPVAEQAAREVLSLPLFPHMTEGQVDTVCDALDDSLASMNASPERRNVR